MLVDYLMNYPQLLKVVMDKFGLFSSSNCYNFILGPRQFVRSGMGTMVSIMELSDHSTFKFVHGNMFCWHSKNIFSQYKMMVDLLDSGVELVKCMQVRRSMDDSWITFDHIEHLKDMTKMTCHVYGKN